MKFLLTIRKIILTNIKDNDNSIKYFPLKEMSIDEIMNEIDKKKVFTIYLYDPKGEKLLKNFKKKLPVIKAAGGVVYNPKGEILFIKRKGKWDLPKGKKDKGENVAFCAIREVEEETGVKKLIITDFKAITYHIFKRNGKYQLKETYWYNMTSDYKGKLIPQAEEDIEKVSWKSPKKAAKVLENSYKNIQRLFED